jgi:hypothetical protein
MGFFRVLMFLCPLMVQKATRIKREKEAAFKELDAARKAL